MSQERDLLRLIAREPDEDAPRLVYADWLEDHGRAERAEFIRGQLRLAEIRRSFPPPERGSLERIFYGAVDQWTDPGDSPERRAWAFRTRQLLDAHEREWLATLDGESRREWHW